MSHKRYRPVVFGVPLVVKLVENVTTCRDLYEDVWQQVKRLVNAPAAQNSGAVGNHTNRALDAYVFFAISNTTLRFNFSL